jgi:hypothetical protein
MEERIKFLEARIEALVKENQRLIKLIPVVEPEIVKYPDFEKPLKK